MATETQARPEGEAAEPKRRFRFPTAFTVLFFVLVLVWILTFIITPGTYSYVSCDGGPPKPVPGGYVTLRAEMDLVIAFSACPQDILPINGRAGRPVEAHFVVA